MDGICHSSYHGGKGVVGQLAAVRISHEFDMQHRRPSKAAARRACRHQPYGMGRFANHYLIAQMPTLLARQKA